MTGINIQEAPLPVPLDGPAADARVSEVTVTLKFRFAGTHTPGQALNAAETALLLGGAPGGLITFTAVQRLARESAELAARGGQ